MAKDTKPITRSEINATRERIWRQARQLDSLIVAMETHDEMEVPYMGTRERSLRWLDNFVGGAWAAYHQATADMPVPPPGRLK